MVVLFRWTFKFVDKVIHKNLANWFPTNKRTFTVFVFVHSLFSVVCSDTTVQVRREWNAHTHVLYCHIFYLHVQSLEHVIQWSSFIAIIFISLFFIVKHKSCCWFSIKFDFHSMECQDLWYLLYHVYGTGIAICRRSCSNLWT